MDGAKGVGKSETAGHRVAKFYYLDRHNERELIRAQMDQLLSQSPSILLDEWQYVPKVWDAVRRLVDEQNDTKFILTGSASPSFRSR
ncbi:AAA family ATPase [uncultured Corynebacterium sp.]|uniref:AAA family ATPase n=1 Tax=uncultured Corynebacterium sp. TaxID=159447 RepID=UPI003449A662